MDQYVIYTDGGCDPNPGPGGWAVLILNDGKRQEISGAEMYSTNNRMELTAAIEALRTLPKPGKVDLYTDSQYLMRGITEWMPKWLVKNWRGTNGPVANKDLWQALLEVSKAHRVEWHWLRGHAGNYENERVDQLCRSARRSLKHLKA